MLDSDLLAPFATNPDYEGKFTRGWSSTGHATQFQWSHFQARFPRTSPKHQQASPGEVAPVELRRRCRTLA